MSNLALRLLTFFVVIPILLLIILFLPHYNYLSINILMVLSSFGLTFESAKIVGLYPCPLEWPKLHKMVRILVITVLGISAPLLALLASTGVISKDFIPAIFTFLVLGLFSIQVLYTQKALPGHNTLEQILRYVFLIVYPGAGLAYTSMIARLPDAKFLLLAFLGVVFANDSAAYVFGRLFGKFSFKPFKISPNKTFIGFAGGWLFSILIMVLFAWLRPQMFPGGIISAIIIGALTGIAVITGDLFESALKRSSGLKDSGSVIPGRGGLLDSLDSLVFSAPLFYYLYVISQVPYFLS